MCHRQGSSLTFVTYGTISNNVLHAADILAKQGTDVRVLRLLNVSPLPVGQLIDHLQDSRTVIVVEETCTGSGIREDLAWELRNRIPDCRVEGLDLGGNFVTHGKQDVLYRHCGLDAESIAKFAREVLDHES